MKRRSGLIRNALLVLAVAGLGLAASSYVLIHERLGNPLASTYSISAAFSSGAGVAPGLGEPVEVSGVRVGQITGLHVSNGEAIIDMSIARSQLEHVYRDATADLVPRTLLKDMQIDIVPGHASSGELPSGGTIAVGQTNVPVDPGDLLAVLDADTRTWLTSLITSLDQATEGRAKDLRELLWTLGPTSVQLRDISDHLAARRHALARLVQNLGRLTQAISSRDGQLGQIVQAGDSTVHALAGQDSQLEQAVTRLPGTLATANDTMVHLGQLSDALAPTADGLIPTARRLPAILSDADRLLGNVVLLPDREIPAFVAATTPLQAELPTLTAHLQEATPSLLAAFKVLTYAANELAYNRGGKNPGFLHWLPWFAHNVNSFLSTSDAHGTAWRGMAIVSCASLGSPSLGPLLQLLLGSKIGEALGC